MDINDYSDHSDSSDGGDEDDDDDNSDDENRIITLFQEVANEIEIEMELISNHSNDSALRDLDETNDQCGQIEN